MERQPRSLHEISMEFMRLISESDQLGLQAKDLVLDAMQHLQTLPRFQVRGYYDLTSGSYISEGEGIILEDNTLDLSPEKVVVVLMKDGIFRLPRTVGKKGSDGLPNVIRRREILLGEYIEYGDRAICKIQEEVDRGDSPA